MRISKHMHSILFCSGYINENSDIKPEKQRSCSNIRTLTKLQEYPQHAEADEGNTSHTLSTFWILGLQHRIVKWHQSLSSEPLLYISFPVNGIEALICKSRKCEQYELFSYSRPCSFLRGREMFQHPQSTYPDYLWLD